MHTYICHFNQFQFHNFMELLDHFCRFIDDSVTTPHEMICTTALVYIDTLALITHIAESVNLSIKYVFFLVQSLLTAVNQRFCDLLTTGFLRLSKNMETFSPTLWVHKSSSTELSEHHYFYKEIKTTFAAEEANMFI